MTPVSTFNGRSVALFGLGGSGLATAKALIAGGANVTAWDDSEAGRAKALAEKIHVEDLDGADWSRFDALILTPGAPLTHPVPHWTVQRAKALDMEVIGDIELFCRERDALAGGAPFVAITGTNGKSTTTALIAHILRRRGATRSSAAISERQFLRWSRRTTRESMSSNVRRSRSISRLRWRRRSAY